MAFARWDPIRDLLAIQQKLDRYAPGPDGWTPAVDIQETPDQYIVTAEVPGMSREDLDIRVHEGRVTIAGVRRERPGQCEQWQQEQQQRGDDVSLADVRGLRSRDSGSSRRRVDRDLPERV